MADVEYKFIDNTVLADEVIGHANISSISDGTLRGAVKKINTDLDGVKEHLGEVSNLKTKEKNTVEAINEVIDSLKTVATSGSYKDLTDKPTIPTVNNGTLTIQRNGSSVATFTANQSSNVTANIVEPLPNMKNHYVISIGDSYGTTGSYPWTTRLKEYLGIPDGQYFTKSVGGYGFATTSNFLTILQSISLTATQKASITDIVVCGGYNDKSYSFETIGTGIATFCTYCKTNFPNAKVWIAFVGAKLTENRDGIATAQMAYSQYAPLNSNSCYINGSENIMIRQHYFSNDNLHPSQSGSDAIGWYISQGMLTGSCTVTMKNAECSYSLNTALVSSTDIQIYSGQNNNVVKYIFICPYSEISFKLKSFTIDCSNKYYKLLKISTNSVMRGFEATEPDNNTTGVDAYAPTPNVYVPILLFGNLNGTIGWHNVMGMFTIIGGSLCVSIAHANTSGWSTLTNVTEFMIPKFEIVGDTITC